MNSFDELCKKLSQYIDEDNALSQYTDFVKQVKEMGVNVVIVGGDTEVIYSDPSILQKYTKVE